MPGKSLLVIMAVIEPELQRHGLSRVCAGTSLHLSFSTPSHFVRFAPYVPRLVHSSISFVCLCPPLPEPSKPVRGLLRLAGVHAVKSGQAFAHPCQSFAARSYNTHYGKQARHSLRSTSPRQGLVIISLSAHCCLFNPARHFVASLLIRANVF